MKFVRSLLLIIIMMVFCFQQWAVIIAFKCNQPFISKNLCVNRKKVNSCCKGKCYLGKQLQKDTDNSTEAKAPVKYKVEVFNEAFSSLSFNRTITAIDLLLLANIQHFHPQQYNTSTYHPPDVVS